MIHLDSKIYTFGGFSDEGFHSLNLTYFDLEPKKDNDLKIGKIAG